ncbi:hypothetical protein B0H13DRAFT_1910749 [Mycena leptocephala]|nr:hypothetical protein B0H13DRAFT_1910749 [Mycena leptocephala]
MATVALHANPGLQASQLLRPEVHAFRLEQLCVLYLCFFCTQIPDKRALVHSRTQAVIRRLARTNGISHPSSNSSIRFARLSNRTGAPCLEFLVGRLKISIAAASPPGFVPDPFVTPPPPGITLTPTRPFLELRPRYLARDPLLKYNGSNQGQVVSPEFRLVSFLLTGSIATPSSTLLFYIVFDGWGPPLERVWRREAFSPAVIILIFRIFYLRTTGVVSIHRTRLVFDTASTGTRRGRARIPSASPSFVCSQSMSRRRPPTNPRCRPSTSSVASPPHAERPMKHGKRADARAYAGGVVMVRTLVLGEGTTMPRARTTRIAVDEVEAAERSGEFGAHPPSHLQPPFSPFTPDVPPAPTPTPTALPSLRLGSREHRERPRRVPRRARGSPPLASARSAKRLSTGVGARDVVRVSVPM